MNIFFSVCKPRAVIRIRVRRCVIRVRIGETAIRIRIVVRTTNDTAIETLCLFVLIFLGRGRSIDRHAYAFSFFSFHRFIHLLSQFHHGRQAESRHSHPSPKTRHTRPQRRDRHPHSHRCSHDQRHGHDCWYSN